MKLEDAARALGPPGRLSRVEKDGILARVEASRGSWFARHRAQLAVGLSSVAAIAVLALVVLPATHSQKPDQLAARGSAGLTLVARCGERAPGECRPGDRLTFDFGGTPPAGYVSLFARRASGDVIWYLPADEAAPSVEIAAHATDGMLDRVAVIDASYAPGTYELFAVVSPRPLSRADIRGFARGDQLVAPTDVVIETRRFVIQEEAP